MSWSKSLIRRLVPARVRNILIEQDNDLPAGLASYSQSGEDRIIDFFITTLGLQNATYLDIGSSHPVWGNNTYLLYRRGLRGVCIDPNPGLEALYKAIRPEDIFMPFAVVPGSEEEVSIQLFEESTFNTISANTSKLYGDFGFKKKDSVRVPAISLKRLYSQSLGSCPDILCMDIEGLDLEVLIQADFTLLRPKLICVEVVCYRDNKEPFIDGRFEEVLEQKGYIKYADTYINQIFADKKIQSQQRFI